MTRKAVIITGAASGIGLATAQLFARQGWLVGLFDIDQQGIDQALEALDGFEVVGQHMDVRVPEQWEAALTDFSSLSGGRLDLLFNNAGIAAAGWFEDIPQSLASDMVGVNLLGAMNGIYACRTLLAGTPGSQIINNGSVLALQGPPFGAVYGATKAALLSLTESLEMELSRDGIGVSILLPAQVDTPLIDRPSFTAVEGSLRDGPLTDASTVAQSVWHCVQKGDLYIPVGPGAGVYRQLVRWFPGFIRWITRRLFKAKLAQFAQGTDPSTHR